MDAKIVERIRELAKKDGRTRPALAKDAGIPHSPTLYQFVQGKRGLPDELLNGLANALGYDIQCVLKRRPK
jgi:transcriptional regulator with XRE-family HTH domain